MTTRPAPVTPNALHVDQAIDRSAPLAALRQRIADSNARFDAIRGAVPAGLWPHLRPGPVDETGWSLLAANPAVAAKLRQLQPRLEATLRDGGWVPAVVRVKVLAPGR